LNIEFDGGIIMKNIKIKLRKLELKDLESYYEWNHPSRAFHKFNGPYFKKESEQELSLRIENWRKTLLKDEEDVLGNGMLIVDEITDELIGQVNWYWKSEVTWWMEVGIVIFNENYWGYGIGYNALKLWIDRLFDEKQEMVRIGLTTWSGNERMMRLSEKLGMKKEATYRNARIVEGKYFDSVSYGILRSEWNKIHI